MHHDQYCKIINTYQSCLGSLKWAFDELKLMKIQFRPIFKKTILKKESNRMQLELLLGEIPLRSENKEKHDPTAFQTALVKYIKEETVKVGELKVIVTNTCNICANLYTNEEIPPHLIEKPALPPYIWGEWISRRCENRPTGLFLTRQFSFFSDNSFWTGEHVFYSDPYCTSVKFVIKTNGHFILTEQNDVIKSAANIDFKIEKSSLTIFNRKMVQELRKDHSCGREVWEVGVPQQLSLTYGCMEFGIVLPSVQYDIIKVEINYEGNILLHMGQMDAENGMRSIFNRPTSFQVPLIKCSGEDHNQRFRKYFPNSSSINFHHFKLLISTSIVYIFFELLVNR